MTKDDFAEMLKSNSEAMIAGITAAMAQANAPIIALLQQQAATPAPAPQAAAPAPDQQDAVSELRKEFAAFRDETKNHVNTTFQKFFEHDEKNNKATNDALNELKIGQKQFHDSLIGLSKQIDRNKSAEVRAKEDEISAHEKMIRSLRAQKAALLRDETIEEARPAIDNYTAARCTALADRIQVLYRKAGRTDEEDDELGNAVLELKKLSASEQQDPNAANKALKANRTTNSAMLGGTVGAGAGTLVASVVGAAAAFPPLIAGGALLGLIGGILTAGD